MGAADTLFDRRRDPVTYPLAEQEENIVGDPIAQGLVSIRSGNVWLAVCCAIYLAWWCVAFNPLRDFPMALKVVGFVATVVCGVIAVLRLGHGVGALPPADAGLPTWAVWVIGAAVYGVLLLITSKVLERTVTTELLLIVAWAALELSCVNAAWGVGAIGGAALWVAIVAVALCAVGAMGCYLAYYALPPVPALIDGMVPLVLCAVAGLIVNGCITV